MLAPKGLSLPRRALTARSGNRCLPHLGVVARPAAAVHFRASPVWQQSFKRTQLFCARPEQSRNVESTSEESIAEYISKNCPSPGLSGQYREQSVDPTFEAVCLPQPSQQHLCPGARLSVPLAPPVLDHVLQQSQVVLAHFEDSNGLMVPKVAARGSTAALAQVTGVQRLGETVLASLRVEERITVQAVSSSPTTGLVLVRAAPLLDRWVYCVRAAAVAELSARPSDRASAEVSTALANLQDVQADLHALMQELGALTTKFMQDPHNEWEDLLDWTRALPTVQSNGGSGDGKTSSNDTSNTLHGDQTLEALQRAMRLSFAVFAATATASMLGIPEEDVRHKRSLAMAQTDVGKRSEDAVEFAEMLRNLLCAKLALGGV